LIGTSLDRSRRGGDFNDDGKSDLLVIAKDAGGLSGIYATDSNGAPSTVLQSWNAD
jgi:hypothetical protein